VQSALNAGRLPASSCVVRMLRAHCQKIRFARIVAEYVRLPERAAALGTATSLAVTKGRRFRGPAAMPLLRRRVEAQLSPPFLPAVRLMA